MGSSDQFLPGVAEVCTGRLKSLLRVGISSKECNQYYNDTALDYDETALATHYNGPQYGAATVHKYFHTRPDCRILDVAAGTGNLGQLLQSRGFSNIDALEPSSEMLNVAKRKKIYKRHINEFLEEKNTVIEDDQYDCLVVSGALGEGHIPCGAIREMSRVVKPDGLVVILIREEYLTDVRDYAGRLEPFMSELEQLGKWQQVERTVVPDYTFDKDGVVFVFKVLESGLKKFISNVL